LIEFNELFFNNGRKEEKTEKPISDPFLPNLHWPYKYIFGKNLYGVRSADFQAVCQNRQDPNVGGEKWLPTFLTPQVVVPSNSACISLLLYGGFIIEIRRHSFVLLFSLQQHYAIL
jgi:hypothetical protein